MWKYIPPAFVFTSKALKIDPFHQDCFIYLGHGQASFCPTTAIMSYLHLRWSSQGSLFIDRDGLPLSQLRLPSFLQSTLQAAGTLGQFSGHSFYNGGATTAAQHGIPDHLIQTKGR